MFLFVVVTVDVIKGVVVVKKVDVADVVPDIVEMVGSVIVEEVGVVDRMAVVVVVEVVEVGTVLKQICF